MPFTRRGLKSVARKMSKIESIGFAFKRQTPGTWAYRAGGRGGGAAAPPV